MEWLKSIARDSIKKTLHALSIKAGILSGPYAHLGFNSLIAAAISYSETDFKNKLSEDKFIWYQWKLRILDAVLQNGYLCQMP